ncbi:MAG: hypothetical protein U1F54_10630 [Burkholderiales bacterium]
MTGGKRSTRKPAPPAALTVPRVRTLRSDDHSDAVDTDPTHAMTRPRRNRKPKFVF